ncbi:hypothetical protein GCM10010377_38550 [Streptomyces viridiviolaceus]|nr:hypothetical protein GCM10010377_38550 [Streptomyces viridiviolaceus]
MATAHGDSFQRAGRGRSSCAASAASSAAKACSACGLNASAPGAVEGVWMPADEALPASGFAGADPFWLGSADVGSTDTGMAESPSSSAGSDLASTVHHTTDNRL